MRKLSLTISILCLLLMSATPFPLGGQDGVYNTFSGLYWCGNASACTHEIGHKLDQASGWPSRSKEFREAVKVFILVESRKDCPSQTLYELFSMDDFEYVEIYANLFRWSGGKSGNMPPIFRPFYDWELAEKLVK